MRTDLDMAGLKEKGKKDIGKELDGMKMRKRWERWKRVGCLALAFMTAAAVFGGCSKGTGERRAEESDGAGGGSGLGDASQEEEQDRGSGRFVETERTLLHTDTYNASKAVYRVGPPAPAPAPAAPAEGMPAEGAPTEAAPVPTEPAPSSEPAGPAASPAPVEGIDGGPGITG